jgi:serine/threonine protein kinase/tetratricopeptide (TPR) repeat protein
MPPEQEQHFVRLALAAGWIDPYRLHQAQAQRASRPDTLLPDLLVEQGWLSPEQRAELESRLPHPVEENTTPVGDWASVLGGSATAAQRGRFVLEPDRPPLEGGMGRVWLAHDDQLGRIVALKEMRDETRDVPALRHRFLVEAQVTAQLEHPGIVPVYELKESADGSGPFYTMRFVEGQTLSQAAHAFHLAHRRGTAGALELRELLTAFVAVCNTLAYAHARGVIHRDLKGSNVVLGRFGEVMVLDWGVAGVLGRADDPSLPPVVPDAPPEQTGGGLGTPDYAAPEQAPSEPATAAQAPPEAAERIDRRTDLFGLGAILYELLTGQAPHASDPQHPEEPTPSSLEQKWERVRQGKVVPVRTRCPWVPRPLEAVCMKALAARPEDRYPSATELADEVRRWLSGEPVRAWSEPWSVRAGRWVRRNRMLATSGAAVAVVALVLGSAGFVYWRWDQYTRQAALRERQERAAERTEAIWKDVVRLRRQLRFTAARTLLEQARRSALESGDEELQQRHQQAEAELNLAEELHQVREQAAELVKGRWNPRQGVTKYPEVLSRHGLDVLGGGDEVVERIRALSVRDEVLACLDDWMSSEPVPARRSRLLEVTNRLDSSSWREEVTEVVRSGDRERLRKILIEADPTRLSPASVRSLVHLAGWRTPESQRLLARARERYPDDFWLHFTLGHQFGDSPDIRGDERSQREAISSLRAALALKPDSAVTLNNLGLVLNDTGDREGAVRCFREAIRLAPRYVNAHSNLGAVLHEKGEVEEAFRCFQEAIRLDSRQPMVHINLGNAYQARKDLEEAIRCYHEALRLDPALPLAHNNLGAALEARGDKEGAIRCYKEALRHDPGYAPAHDNLGRVLRRKGDLDGPRQGQRRAYGR